MNVSEETASGLATLLQYAVRDAIEPQDQRDATYGHLMQWVAKLGLTIEQDGAGAWSLLVVAPIDWTMVSEYLNGLAYRTANAVCMRLTLAAHALSQGWFAAIEIERGVAIVVGPSRPERFLRLEQRHSMQRMGFAYAIDAGFGNPWAAIIRPTCDPLDIASAVNRMNDAKTRREIRRAARRKGNT